MRCISWLKWQVFASDVPTNDNNTDADEFPPTALLFIQDKNILLDYNEKDREKK